MLKLVTGMRVKRGFTLIEILVVVLIIGITLGFAMLAFGDFGGSRRIQVAAEQFVSYVKLVQQQAILESSTLGIKLNGNSYQALRFQAKANWQPLSHHKIFHVQHFPEQAVTHLITKRNKTGTPEIVINASGDLTPFKLQIGTAKHANLVTIVGQHNGNISLQGLESP